MTFAITNRLAILADRLEDKITEAACDVESAVNDVERELIEIRARQEALLERLEQIARRLGPFLTADKRCGCGETVCSCGQGD